MSKSDVIEIEGVVVEKLSKRKGTMTDMRPTGGNKTRIVFTSAEDSDRTLSVFYPVIK